MKKNPLPSRTIPWFLITIFLSLVAGIFIAGFIFYQRQQERIKIAAQNDLAAFADLKAEQIAQWRQERIIDAELVYNNAAIARQVNVYFKIPEKTSPKKDLLKFMKSFQDHAGYKSILLLDAKSNVRLSVSNLDDSVCSYGHTFFKEALLYRQITFSDLHRSKSVPYVHIDLMVPIFSPDRSDSTIIGTLLLRIDPQVVLFPLIKTWPTPSRTSETLLLEQEGDSIVYLNELRHRKNTTLSLRMPISNEQLPASMAARGIEGIVEGIDYRSVPVLAAIRKIQNTPWFMITKVDQEEIYAPLRSQTWIAAIGMFLFLLAAGGIMVSWWRHQRARFYRDKYLAEVERQALMKHFDYIVKYANDSFLLIDMNGKIVEANDQACRMYGYTREELTHLYIHDLRSEQTRSQIEKQMKQVEERSGLVFETEHRRQDGTLFPAEVSSRFIKIDETRFYQSVIRDITERKQAEEMLRESEEKYRSLSENSLEGIGLSKENQIIYANRALLKIFGYNDIEEFLAKPLLYYIAPESQIKIQEMLKNVKDGKSHEKRFSYKIIRKDGEKRDLEIITDQVKIGNDLYTQSTFRDITEQKIAEDALLQSEERYRRLFELSPDTIFIQSEGNIVLINEAGVHLFGAKSAEELIGRQIIHLMHPDYREIVAERIKHLKELQSFVPMIEEKYLRLDGSSVDVEVVASPFLFKGKPAAHVVVRDITERKLVEQSLLESEDRFRRIFEEGPLGMATSGSDFAFIKANAAFCKMMGYEKNELTSLTFKDITHPEHIAQDAESIKKILVGDIPFYSTEKRYIRKDKRVVWGAATITVIRDHNKRFLYFLAMIEDITERKYAEEALRESEERYRELYENASIGIYRTTPDGDILLANPRLIDMLGYSSLDEIKVHNLERERFEPSYQRTDFKQKMEQEGEVRGLESAWHRKDGSIIFVRENAKAMRGQDNSILYYDGIAEDITEHKHAEESLRKSEELFKMLVESSPVAIAVFSGATKDIEYVSHRFTQLFGYEQQDIPSLDSWWSLAYPINEYRNQIESIWNNSVEQAQLEANDTEPLESVITCKDGSNKYIESTFSSMGELTLVFFSDLTQHRLAAEALRQTHAFNDLLIQTMPFGMNIVDEEGNILFISKTMKDMLTVDAVDMCCWKVYKDDGQQCQACPLKTGISFGRPDVIETTGVLGGKTFQISHVGMMYEGRKAMLEVFQDITEQKKLQQELMQSQKMLSIGTLAGGIAHDFNNILGIILGYTSILHSMKDNPQKYSDGVNAIKQAVDRGAALVRQILTFARKTDVAFEPLDVPDLTRELVSMLQQTFPKIITFNKEIETQLPLINADHTQIHQILLNLCVNARDAMPDGGVITIKAHLAEGDKLRERFPEANDHLYICITISDTGTGMDEATRNRIFDPFFTTKEKGKGTGLGLSVVYGVVQAHHGFVDVESEVGSGTTFRLYLPVSKESLTAIEAAKAEDLVRGGTETLLVVEDEDLLLDMVQLLLEAHGYTVLTAKDGMEAVNIYNEHAHEIALVLSDMGLPKLSGDGEFRKLKEINPAVKMILASGYFEPDMKATLESAGVREFLQKPYVIEEVLAKIRKTLKEQ